MQLVKDIIEIAAGTLGGRRLFSAFLAASLWATASTLSIVVLIAVVGAVPALLLAMTATVVLEGSLVAVLTLRLRRGSTLASPATAAELLGIAILSLLCWVPGLPAALAGLLWLATPFARMLGRIVGRLEPELLDLARVLGGRDPGLASRESGPTRGSAPGLSARPPASGEEAEQGAHGSGDSEQQVEREQSEPGNPH